MFLNEFQVFNCSVSVHFCFVEASGGAAAPGERVVRGSRVEWQERTMEPPLSHCTAPAQLRHCQDTMAQLDEMRKAYNLLQEQDPKHPNPRCSSIQEA